MIAFLKKFKAGAGEMAQPLKARLTTKNIRIGSRFAKGYVYILR